MAGTGRQQVPRVTQHHSLHSSHTDDKLEQQHSLFTRYKDPCRLGPGEEKPWAIGKQGAGLSWASQDPQEGDRSQATEV